eukprot:NODE_14915_length_1078_cov_2.585699.p1 GENE.NODE_14915_length_1078_cov_2.585699~~NODE_14915_length_1078_cov_2.585699.p1  ORF type:complete len:229 (+),score=81.65 NODE_14915_length_1078_cov_2.585699:1-687(+)
MPVPSAGAVLYGTVKNYGPNTGYGFIKPADDAPFIHDLYFNEKDFAPGCSEAMRGKLQCATVKFNVRLTMDGMAQAKNIEVVAPPDDCFEEELVSMNKSCWGLIKSYRPMGGYGFVDCPELGRDVWFPRRELRGEIPLTEEMRGTEVVFELWLQGDDKYQAREVTPVTPGSAFAQPANTGGSDAGDSKARRAIEDTPDLKRSLEGTAPAGALSEGEDLKRRRRSKEQE